MGGADLSAFEFNPQVEDAKITPHKYQGPIWTHARRKMRDTHGSRQVNAAKQGPFAKRGNQAAPKRSTQFNDFLPLAARNRPSQETSEVGSGQFFGRNQRAPFYEGAPKQVRTNGKGLGRTEVVNLRNEPEDVEELLPEERSNKSKRKVQGAAAAAGKRFSERLASKSEGGEDEEEEIFGGHTYNRKRKKEGAKREERRGDEGHAKHMRKRGREVEDEGAELELPPAKRKKGDKNSEYKPHGRSFSQRAPQKRAEPQVIHLDSEDTPQKENPEGTERQAGEPRRLVPEEGGNPGPSPPVPSEDSSCSYVSARCWLGKFAAHRCTVYFDAARLKIKVLPEFVQGGKESMTFTWNLRDLAPGKSFLQQACPTEVVVIAFHFKAEVPSALAPFLDPNSQALPSKYIVIELDSNEWKRRHKKDMWPHELREHYSVIKDDEVARYTDDRPVTGEARLDPKAEQKRQAAAVASNHHSARSSRHAKPVITTFHFPADDPDAVTLSNSDLARLEPQEFLNDTLIDFYVKFLQVISHTQTARIHFMNSFFFKKLMETAQEAKKRGVLREEAFKRMNKWTRKVDIFDMDYVIIPVNQSLHWSLAILVYPGGGDFPASRPVERAVVARTPCILQLDSMAGGHSNVEDLLRLYLTELWLASHPAETRPSSMREPLQRFSKAVMPFIPVKVPQQDNHCDCGLFLLHYVEQFIQDPPPTFDYRQGNKQRLYKMSLQWFQVGEASVKRDYLKELIVRLAKELERGNASILEKDSLRALWHAVVRGRKRNAVLAQGLKQPRESSERKQEKTDVSKLSNGSKEDKKQAEGHPAFDEEVGLMSGYDPSWPSKEAGKAVKSPLSDHVFEAAARGGIEDPAELENPISVNLEVTPPQKRRAEKPKRLPKEESPEDLDPLSVYRRYSQLGGNAKAEKEVDAPRISEEVVGLGNEGHVSETDDEEADVQTERKRARSAFVALDGDRSNRKRVRSESIGEEWEARASNDDASSEEEKAAVEGRSLQKEEDQRPVERVDARKAKDVSSVLGARADWDTSTSTGEEQVATEGMEGVHYPTANGRLHELEDVGGVPLASESGELLTEEQRAHEQADSIEVNDMEGANSRSDPAEEEARRKEGGWQGLGSVRGMQGHAREESLPRGASASAADDFSGEKEGLGEGERAMRAGERHWEGSESNEKVGSGDSEEPRTLGRKAQHRRSESLGGGAQSVDRDQVQRAVAASVAARVLQPDRDSESHYLGEHRPEGIVSGQGQEGSVQNNEARGLAPFLESAAGQEGAAHMWRNEEPASPTTSNYLSVDEAPVADDANPSEGEGFVASGRGAKQTTPRSSHEILQRVRRPVNGELRGQHTLGDEAVKGLLDCEASPVGGGHGRELFTEQHDRQVNELLQKLRRDLAERGLESEADSTQKRESKIDLFRKQAVARLLDQERPELGKFAQPTDGENCRSEQGDEDGLTLTGAQRMLGSEHTSERHQEPRSQEFSEDGMQRGSRAGSPGNEADSGGLQGHDSWRLYEEGSPRSGECLESGEEPGPTGWGLESSSLGCDPSMDSEELFHRAAAMARAEVNGVAPGNEKHTVLPPPELPYETSDAPADSEKRSPLKPLDGKANASEYGRLAEGDDECAVTGARCRSSPYGQQKATKVGANTRGQSLEKGSVPPWGGSASERSLRKTRHASDRPNNLTNGKGDLVSGGFVSFTPADGKRRDEKSTSGKGRDLNTGSESEGLSFEQDQEDSPEWQSFINRKPGLAELDFTNEFPNQEIASPKVRTKSLKKMLESDTLLPEPDGDLGKGPKLSHEVEERDWVKGGPSPVGRPEKLLQELYKETPELDQPGEERRENSLSGRLDAPGCKTPEEERREKVEIGGRAATPEKVFVNLVDSDDEEGAKAAKERKSSGQMSSAERKRCLEELKAKRSQTVSKRLPPVPCMA